MDQGRRKSIEELYKRAVKVAKIKGHSQIAEDFAGWIAAKWLEGKAQHQSLDYSLIDFLRLEYGSAGLRCGADGLLRSRRASEASFSRPDSDSNDEITERMLASSSYSQNVNSRDTDDSKQSIDIAGMLSIEDEAIYRMRIDEEMTHEEISLVFGVTESRISQRWSSILKQTEQTLGMQKFKDRIEDDPNFTKLEIEWISL